MTFLLAILGGYLLVCALAFLFQPRLVFFPDRTLVADPGRIGLEFEEVTFEAERGVRLHGWWIPAARARGTLLFLHGNAGNISHRLDSVAIFHRLGLSVLLFDYRGYGQSGGRVSEAGTYADAGAAWRHLVEGRGIEPRRIVLFGRSLGAAVAIELATHVDPGGLIVESAFPSVVEMGVRAYPWLPVRLLARIRFDSASRVGRIAAPKLFVHSREDDVVPFRLGRRLYDLSPGPKELLEIGGSHNDGFLTSGDRYVEGLDRFLARVLGDGG